MTGSHVENALRPLTSCLLPTAGLAEQLASIGLTADALLATVAGELARRHLRTQRTT